MDYMVKEAALELTKAVVETMNHREPPRDAKEGVLDALEPLILAIAELQVAQRQKVPND